MPIEKIIANGKEVILIGTAHVSKKSIEEVEETIQKEKPSAIGVELCEQRLEQLMNEKKWSETDVESLLKSKKIYLFVLNLWLSAMQKRIGNQVEVKPGSEFLKAIELAKQNNSELILLDRKIETTFQRALKLMPLKEKIRLLSYTLNAFFSKEEISIEKIEEAKKQELIDSVLEELSKKSPTVKKVFVDERDAIIADKILNSNAKKIVVVIGAGHLKGVKKFLLEKQETKEFFAVPKKKSVLKYIGWSIPILFVVLIAWAFIAKGQTIALNSILYWVLITGSLSAIGVLLARGHWLSILTAFIASPITTLHPLLASGWFAGYVELKKRKPTVNDFEELKKIDSFSDFFRNRVSRVLLVAAFANIGSTIGVIIAFPMIAKIIF